MQFVSDLASVKNKHFYSPFDNYIGIIMPIIVDKQEFILYNYRQDTSYYIKKGDYYETDCMRNVQQ